MDVTPTPAAGNGGGSSNFEKASFLLYLALVTVAFIYLLKNFLMPLFLAAVFTGLTYPVYIWIHSKVKSPSIASLLTLIAFILVLILPLGAIASVAYQEAVHFFAGLDLDILRQKLESFINLVQRRFPGLLQRVNPQDLSNMASGGLQNAAEFVLKNSANISLSLANNLLSFFLMLFMMFYFFVDGPHFVQRIIKWSPLKDEYERILIEKFTSVSKGTLKGILVIGVIQGTIGSLLFWATGLRSPVFLGSLMIFGSIIPALGTAIVWVPVALMFLFTGHLIKALIVTIVGALVIGTVDNLVRPYLVGKDIKMHDLLVLLSTLGGLGVFGPPGFIIGPVIAALFLSIWNIYEEIFADELTQNKQVGFRTGKISQILRNNPPPGTEKTE